MVSMKDVARACGVSVATVSKALAGHSDIGEETRERVRQTAKAMGYQANSAARALKTKRTYDMGVLFVDQRSSGLAHDYFSAVLDSLRVEAERNGYDITFISANVGKSPATYLQHCRYRGVDGVVIASVDFLDPMVLELVSSDIPVVTIDHVFNNRVAVLSDNISGAEELTKRALSMGHQRIAFVHGDHTSVTENRLVGFYRACASVGINVPDEYVVPGAYHDTDSCYEAVKRLLSVKEPPTCILLPDDFSAIGGLQALYEAGLSVPGDVSILGYDGIGLSQVITPKLSTWRQNTAELGRVAAAKLVQIIENPKTTPPEQIVVDGHFLPGGTLAPPSRSR